jgi:Uma2 family endonuclease
MSTTLRKKKRPAIREGEPGVVSGPDAAWLDRDRYDAFSECDAFSEEEQERYLPLCPDFLIELRSRTDRVADLTAWLTCKGKMEEYRTARRLPPKLVAGSLRRRPRVSPRPTARARRFLR